MVRGYLSLTSCLSLFNEMISSEHLTKMLWKNTYETSSLFFTTN